MLINLSNISKNNAKLQTWVHFVNEQPKVIFKVQHEIQLVPMNINTYENSL